MARVTAGTLKLGSAAELLGISYRQAKRLYRRYRAEGATGLKHRSAGRRSNRATVPTIRTRALALVREKYGGPVDELLMSRNGCGGKARPTPRAILVSILFDAHEKPLLLPLLHEEVPRVDRVLRK